MFLWRRAISRSSLGEGLFDNRIRWMTVKDAAKYLGRSENAIRLLIYRGVLRPYKLGRRTYLNKSEIDEEIVTSALMRGG